MPLWGGSDYTKHLESELADAKDQIKKLMDVIVTLKGVAPVFNRPERAPARTRLSLDAARRRAEAFERIS